MMCESYNMRQAAGFITEDGTFFETIEEARVHEAESRLRGVLAALTGDGATEIDHFLSIVHTIRLELGEYLNATETLERNKAVEDREEVDEGGQAKVSANLGHVSSTEEDLAALLKLPARGPVNVSNVGSGPRPEKVQERREEHGPGVRGADASGVRGGKDMAAKQGAEPGHARPSGGKKDIQKRKVERGME